MLTRSCSNIAIWLIVVMLFGLVLMAWVQASHCIPVNSDTAPSKRETTTNITAQPAFVADFADPSVLEINGQWYAYATNYRATHVQLATSSDFQTWVYHSGIDVLPELPRWVNTTRSNVWAPKVWRREDGTYIMYFSATHVSMTISPGVLSRAHCIGVATATDPRGPFVSAQSDAYICPADKGGAIDPSFFRDTDGLNYLVYKIDGNSIGHGGRCGNTVEPILPTPIMLQAVANDGITLIGPPLQILDRNDRDGPLVEAPSLAKRDDGQYYLFYSSNCWNSAHYNVGFAVAPAIKGPYIKTNALLDTGTAGLLSPGGADVSNDGTKLVFHGTYERKRTLYTASLESDNSSSTIKNLVVNYY